MKLTTLIQVLLTVQPIHSYVLGQPLPKAPVDHLTPIEDSNESPAPTIALSDLPERDEPSYSNKGYFPPPNPNQKPLTPFDPWLSVKPSARTTVTEHTTNHIVYTTTTLGEHSTTRIIYTTTTPGPIIITPIVYSTTTTRAPAAPSPAAPSPGTCTYPPNPKTVCTLANQGEGMTCNCIADSGLSTNKPASPLNGKNGDNGWCCEGPPPSKNSAQVVHGRSRHLQARRAVGAFPVPAREPDRDEGLMSESAESRQPVKRDDSKPSPTPVEDAQRRPPHPETHRHDSPTLAPSPAPSPSPSACAPLWIVYDGQLTENPACVVPSTNYVGV